MTTFIVTIDSESPYSDLAGVLLASDIQSWSIKSLDSADFWPTEVWTAFERAQHERTQRNVGATDDRRHEGNTLVHPATRFISG